MALFAEMATSSQQSFAVIDATVIPIAIVILGQCVECIVYCVCVFYTCVGCVRVLVYAINAFIT